MDSTGQNKATTTSRQITRRRILGTTAAILTLPVFSRFADAATSRILAVRTWPADEYTRVTLELNAPIKSEHFTLDGPNRLVVDLQGISMSEALNSLISKIKPNDPYISQVRVAQNRANHFTRNSGGQSGGRSCKYAEGFQSIFPRTVDSL